MSFRKRARVAGLLLAASAGAAATMVAPKPAAANVCTQVGVTTDGSTPQPIGPCVTVFPEWTKCFTHSGNTAGVRDYERVCVPLP